jgi:protein TonB
VKWTALKLSWGVSVAVHAIVITTAGVIARHSSAPAARSGGGESELQILIAASVAPPPHRHEVQSPPPPSNAASPLPEAQPQRFSLEHFSKRIFEALEPEMPLTPTLSPSEGERVAVRADESFSVVSSDASEVAQPGARLVTSEIVATPSESEGAAVFKTEVIADGTPSWVAQLHNPKLQYPREARRRKQQGDVLLSVSVSEQGVPLRVQIKAGSGFALLDNAASEAVRQWRFEPARKGAAAVASEVEVPIQFRLTIQENR